MLTFEDMTQHFLEAAASLDLSTHPEYWLNSRSLEREFACTCHAGSCEDAENHSSCVVSFTWGPLDTVLSLDGPAAICDFFHEPDPDCLHLRTSSIPPLVLDLSYSLTLNGTMISEETMLSLTQMLKLRASEHSRRTIETRPGINMVLHENRLQPDTLTLQQRVELPIWHPEGMRGLHELREIHDDQDSYSRHWQNYPRRSPDEHDEDEEVVADNPKPEEWIPQMMVEVCQDILHVLAALDASVSYNI